MFGLSIEERMTEKIKKSCEKHIAKFRDDVLFTVNKLTHLSDEEITQYIIMHQKNYFDDVAEEIIMKYIDTRYIKSYSQVKYQLTTQDIPGWSGSAEIINNDGIMAGFVYIFCYSGYAQKPASTYIASMLNHYQIGLIEQVLYEVDQILSSRQ